VAAFEALALPHLRAAHDLARWLLGNEHDAEDVLQEALVRAFRFSDSFHGESARTWLLAIVRNQCFTFLRRGGSALAQVDSYVEELHPPSEGAPAVSGSAGQDPEAAALLRADAGLVDEALSALAPEFREALVLRELEGLAYKEIAQVAGVPIGTVMSRLSRARAALGREVRRLERPR
jgi:RNA polymerase sigma-70 factor (ECF subfamily)